MKQDKTINNNNSELKLNTKRTIIISLAFFTILMLWQVYNNYCPLFLKDLFENNFGQGNYKYAIGMIMAADNIFALFLMPLFGAWSDKTKSKLGKRMPFIIAGTIIAIIAFPFIPFLFLKNSLIGVALMMGVVLLAMNIYRNPAVALMPDMTPKPLRSKANAIINFVGYVGAIFAGFIALFIPYNHKSIIVPFVLTSVFMLIALIVLVIKIKENKIENEMHNEMIEGEKQSEAVDEVSEDKPLSKINKRNLLLIIGAVFIWYFAFNAVETFWSSYCEFYLGYTSWSLATIILTVASMITFLFAPKLTNKVGRKNTVIIGIIAMIISLFFATFIGMTMPKNAESLPWQFYMLLLMFIINGIGWALINVNSYPMVVEIANQNNIGKFTGYYYTSSMLAQSITPAIIGFVMDFLGYNAFFPYATIFMVIALIVFSFVTTKNDLTPFKLSKIKTSHSTSNNISNNDNNKDAINNNDSNNINNEE